MNTNRSSNLIVAGLFAAALLFTQLNRIVGDQFLPAAQRFTRTNIRKLTKTTPLMDSGLFGPVRIVSEALSTMAAHTPRPE